jgi:ubiquinone biosynthesis protein UbiJ
MAKQVEIKILRPVNPEGISFVRYVFGAIAAQVGGEFISKHRKTISRMITKLGYRIADKIGGGYILGSLVLEIENDSPKKLKTKEIKILKEAGELEEELEVEAEE